MKNFSCEKCLMPLATMLTFLVSIVCTDSLVAEQPLIDYQKSVQPLLNKYCSGCHSDADKEAGFSSESYQSLQAGIKNKPVILPGDIEGSLLLRVFDKNAENAMPPEGEPQPTATEIALLRGWIKAGAHGPKTMQPDRFLLNVPKVSASKKQKSITAIAYSKHGLVAVGRFEEVLFFNQKNKEKSALHRMSLPLTTPLFRIENFSGKVNAISFSADGTRVAIASGVSGRGGQIIVFNFETQKRELDFRGHLDLIYDIEFSPEGTQLATCSYDKSMILWDAKTGKQLRTFPGHNGAVYDLCFSPDGHSLFSASADDTCKLWRVKDGFRLDTLGQPLKEEYACAFSPDGKFIAAVGADKKLRVWKHVSKKQAKINPQLFAKFAHQAPVSHLLWQSSGTHLLTFSENGMIKLWNANGFNEVHLWDEKGSGTISAVAISPQGNTFYVGTFEGTVSRFTIPEVHQLHQQETSSSKIVSHLPASTGDVISFQEIEPNQIVEQAQQVKLPAKINGKIEGKVEPRNDFDLYRFSAKQGEKWLIEVRADRDKSPLDPFIEVLSLSGEKVKRINLQAVRESYFTFRGKNSDQTNDFRLFNWTEMKLNEYLYANGEVTRLFRYPRGADSGFDVYPAKGKRYGFFGTSPLFHALGEPCYIVQPIPVGEKIIPNGLPVFPVYYENDDAVRRDAGKDSRLFFVAPETQDYLIKISDVRGSEGANFKYSLEIKVPKPDFSARVLKETVTLSPGSRQEFQVGITRQDNFEGEVEIVCDAVPEGIQITSPILIEAGQIEAQGIITVAPDYKIPKDLAKQIQFTATAMIGGKKVSHPLKAFKELKAGGLPKLTLQIVPAKSGRQPISSPEDELLEFVITPGETILLKVIAKRNGFDAPISFGKEDSGRNLPFGVFVDNIGLNGLLITEKNLEREFFITCDPVAKPQSRLFHIRTPAAGGHASQSVLLHVREK